MIEIKNQLRKEIAKRKSAYSAEQLIELSSGVVANLESLDVFGEAKVVLLYYSMPDEVSTVSLIQKYKSSKQIILPIVTKEGLILKRYLSEDDLEVSKYGIKEPTGEVFVDYDKIDMVVVPGVAFDDNLNRMGRGKGYYDGLLPKISAPRVAICFDFQIVDKVPADKNDVRMDRVIGDKIVLQSLD